MSQGQKASSCFPSCVVSFLSFWVLRDHHLRRVTQVIRQGHTTRVSDSRSRHLWGGPELHGLLPPEVSPAQAEPRRTEPASRGLRVKWKKKRPHWGTYGIDEHSRTSNYRVFQPLLKTFFVSGVDLFVCRQSSCLSVWMCVCVLLGYIWCLCFVLMIVPRP